MSLNVNRVRQLLKEFDFSALFRDELGWDTRRIKWQRWMIRPDSAGDEVFKR